MVKSIRLQGYKGIKQVLNQGLLDHKMVYLSIKQAEKILN